MCGIVGIVRLDGRELVDGTRLKRMRDVLAHRGPDGAGELVDGPVALGHRRLAIVDVAGGQQPLASEDGRVSIVCNGEIYNHAALRLELERRGHTYRTRSDIESIVHLYEEEGVRCVERLRGMFAFALWDRAGQRLVLGRDRLGIKPLYYACTGDELLFASEIKAILAAGTVKPQFEETVLPEFLTARFVSGERTFFRGIAKLLPGRTLTWSADQGIERRRYWRLPAPVSCRDGRGDSQAFAREARELRRRLEEVVASHLMSDVPLGLFLSGGIDSSALAGIMAPMVQKPLRTFSVGFPEPEANELDFARLMARRIGAQHREVVVSEGEFFRRLPGLVWHEDEPIAFSSSVPLNIIAQAAREDVKVVLTGEGSDELFLGYSRYWLTRWNDRAARLYRSVLPAVCRRRVARAAERLPAALKRYVGRTPLLLDSRRDLVFENFAVFQTRLQRDLLLDESLLEHDADAKTVEALGHVPGDELDAMARLDIETYLVELLMKQDQMTMAASLESRVPFLDHEFVEYALTIPTDFKLRGLTTKAVLRAAVRDIVPRPILRRGKKGFPVPLAKWFREESWPTVEELVLGERARARRLFEPSVVRALAQRHHEGVANHAEQLWLLVTLEIWQRLFLDGDDVNSITPES